MSEERVPVSDGTAEMRRIVESAARKAGLSVTDPALSVKVRADTKLSRSIERQLELPGMPQVPVKVKDPMLEAFTITPYVNAPEVKLIAEDLMDHHTERWQAIPEIIYLFSVKAPKAHGQDAIATCRKVGGLSAYLLRKQAAEFGCRRPDQYNQEVHRFKFECDHTFVLPTNKHVVKADPLFVITWHWNAWQFAGDKLRIAVTDHEMHHVGVDYADKGDGYKFHIIPHSIEEFAVIVERYGAYAEDIKIFQAALQSGELARRERNG